MGPVPSRALGEPRDDAKFGVNMEFVVENLPRLLHAFLVTVEISTVSLIVGFFAAIPVAMMRMSANRLMYWLATAYVFFFRGTPLIAQLFLVYYGAGQFWEGLQSVGLWSFFKEPWNCALVTLTLNTVAYSSEIWRGGIQGIPRPEIEAARACGLSAFQQLRHIILPRALGIAWPAYTNEVVYQIQATSLVSLISVMDITGVARSIAARNFAYYEAFITAAMLYLILVYSFLWMAKKIEKRLHGHLQAAN